MFQKKQAGFWAAGFCAGSVSGLFGAGGGMVLIPMLTLLTDTPEREVFPLSISIILPICAVSLTYGALTRGLDISAALPYLIGSAAGGFLAGFFGQKIPVTWLHKGLGILILWGGIRYLC